MWSTYLLIIAALAIQLETGEAAGMRYRDASTRVDPASFMSCRHRARVSRIDCVSGRCYGAEDPCTKVCNGDETCMRQKCNALQSECHRTCECAEAQDIIYCTATSCWNEVYSCEYAVSVSGLVYSCPDVNLDQSPFWPAPDNALSGYVCNVGKITKKQLQIENQAEACVNNVTKPGQLPAAEERTGYLQACLCCEMSAIVASIWDTCPNTKPFLMTADSSKLYEPGNIPKNGTGMLTSMGGVISTPVSGSSFAWTLGTTATPSTTREFKATACQGAQ
ncbi:hypothetical protein BDV33DRAFT_192370 [Aspergillus novoparasiticus]|uniref:Uncharacterized protein n=1 Tax=Aspergillus novoparasiticus TaxID=986946 RepID=A0A5N6ENA2_9EURO|nr:hypothetical protein BDV33DRAFT_192370 [Aspergillus novoparasiticus]